MNNQDRRGIAFANMQADIYGIIGVLFFAGLVVYGVACLIWGPDQVQVFLSGLSAK